ncbi:MAG: SCP2 sterol-binding domain-containing protein [Lachnospiraceae bacterium]|nr:SCP2 sterol-binding domain-containing protein [Lachnospiraceae bacterium]
MTYEEIVHCVRAAYENADAREIYEHIAVQVNITGEGEGAFYIEVAGRAVSVEPYDYYDRDGLITASADTLINLANGSLSYEEALQKGLLRLEGNIDKFNKLAKIKPAVALQKPAVKAEEKAEARTEKETAVKAEKKAEAKPEKKAAVKAEKKAEAKPEKKAAVKTEKKAEAKPEKKAAVKAESKETAAESKAEVKAEAKPEVKAETKSVEQPAEQPAVKPAVKTRPKATP